MNTQNNQAGSGEECETVTIKGDAGPTRINKSDYDEKKHGKILGGKEAEKDDGVKPLKIIKDVQPVNGYYLAKNGKKGDEERFVVVDDQGLPVTAIGVEPDGYKTDKEAFAAMALVPPAKPAV